MAKVMRVGLVLGMLLCACSRPEQKAEAASKGPAVARSEPLQARIEKERPVLQQGWAEEARSLALAPRPAPGGSQADSETATLWSSEAESRLRTLLLTDGPARRWATFGLGLRCQNKPERIQSALATGVAGWAVRPDLPSAELLDVMGWSMGACANAAAESTLRGWLNPDGPWAGSHLSHAAIVGLGILADRRGELSEQTQAALLDSALGSDQGWALYPLSRLSQLSDAVGQRLLDVAGELLGQATPARRFVILALGSAGPLASGPLGQILLAKDYPPDERSTAAQALSRLGTDGQKVLDETARDLLRRGLPTTAKSELWAPLRAALLAVDLPTHSVPELRTLTNLQLPEADTAEARAQRRRLVWLRCRAAALIARDRSLSAPLLNCDPDHGEVFQLAQISVLSRSRIEAQRLGVFEDLATSKNPRVAQEALRLIPAHPELESVSQLLATALSSGNPGNQATAAKILAAYPARASKKAGDPMPEESIVTSLKKMLEHSDELPDETLTSALSAAGALGALTLKPAVETHCDGPRPALHEPAERALGLLGSPKRTCPASGQRTAEKASGKGPLASSAPASSPVAVSAPVTLRFQSDFGPLDIVLDDPDTQETRRAIVELARAGRYTTHPVHRTSEGSALLFGDPDGDGYDDSRLAVSSVELSPSPYLAMSVGLSSFSDQSTGTQLFVSLAEAPHLRGRRVRLGHARGPWHLLWPGDPLRDLEILDNPTP